MGSHEHVRADIDRLRVAASDMRQAAAGARHLGAIRAGKLPSMHDDADRALETGVVVSYARPFTRQGIGQLDSRVWEPANPDDLKLHEDIIRHRNIRYAHTDKTPLRVTEDVFDTGHFTESWSRLSDDAWPRIETLAEAQAEAFDNLANALQGTLRALPQHRAAEGSRTEHGLAGEPSPENPC